MRKRYLQDYKMFAEADNFDGEETMGEAGPSTEGGASKDGEEADVDVES